MGHLDPARTTTQLVYLALLTKHLRVRIEKKKKAKPSKQEQQRNTRDPLTSPNCTRVDLGTLSGSIALIVSWSGVYCSCIECNVQNAWCGGGWGYL
jgi:stalled ribosome alternative rescue factor ArfA